MSRHGLEREVIGFLDDAPHKKGMAVGGVPVLGGIDWARSTREHDLSYVIAVSDTRAKQRIVERLIDPPPTFMSIVHPSVILASGVRVEPGAILNAGVVVAYDTVIGAHSTINLNATVGHDCVIGPFATVAPGANIAGRVHIGEGCDVGMNATIAAGITVGAWSVIGLGSVVIRNVANAQQVFGNPARAIAVRQPA
jgi:sugar O-acyltransferase (sialic acid O-acetyltransferase NeuD family)